MTRASTVLNEVSNTSSQPNTPSQASSLGKEMSNAASGAADSSSGRRGVGRRGVKHLVLVKHLAGLPDEVSNTSLRSSTSPPRTSSSEPSGRWAVTS
jgi:hypothetical protein